MEIKYITGNCKRKYNQAKPCCREANMWFYPSAVVQDYSSIMKIVGLSLMYSQLKMYKLLRYCQKFICGHTCRSFELMKMAKHFTEL
jgi:hypothetical protein